MVYFSNKKVYFFEIEVMSKNDLQKTRNKIDCLLHHYAKNYDKNYYLEFSFSPFYGFYCIKCLFYEYFF